MDLSHAFSRPLIPQVCMNDAQGPSNNAGQDKRVFEMLQASTQSTA